MAPPLVHLPNGQTLTVSPVFAGVFFKANELNPHHSVFPPGWTIVLHTKDGDGEHSPRQDAVIAPSTAAHTQRGVGADEGGSERIPRTQHVHRYRQPTLCNDHFFISSISNPSSSEFKPATSPTRQIAMMLWATLWWYFHQPEPSLRLHTAASAGTPEVGRPKGDWIVHVDREGIFKGKHLLPKLERMGLISSRDSSVGCDPDDGVRSAGKGWTNMFACRKSFWQLDARIYLFTLSPAQTGSPYPSGSPASSRPASPVRGMSPRPDNEDGSRLNTGVANVAALDSRHSTPPGPFQSTSHLPTFYPPPPLQWSWTDGRRHPLRPKPPRQGETFYTRFIPSVGQYLSFRVASLSKLPCVYRGPASSGPSPTESVIPTIAQLSMSSINDTTPTGPSADASRLTDIELLHKWMNDPRVAHSWGESGPIPHQTEFLTNSLQSQHSFPVIGSFDGKPFGYFEIYWAKEDKISPQIECGNWDRGLHCLVGEQEFRGPHRVSIWLSALIHYCWLSDLRTEVVLMEPRVDNEKLVLTGAEPWSLANACPSQAPEVLPRCGVLQGKRNHSTP